MSLCGLVSRTVGRNVTRTGARNTRTSVKASRSQPLYKTATTHNKPSLLLQATSQRSMFDFTFAPRPTNTGKTPDNIIKSSEVSNPDDLNKNLLYITRAHAKGEYGFFRIAAEQESSTIAYYRDQVALSRVIEGTRQESWIAWVLSVLLFKQKVRYDLLGDLLYRHTKEHCERFEWSELGLPATFASWFNVTLLHVWMMLVRIRAVEDENMRKIVAQRVIDCFFLDIERGIVVTANVTNPIIVGKTNKLLLKTYYGSLAALDDAFLRGDAQLADALYRNLYAFDTDACSAEKLELIVRYLRRALYKLDNMEALPLLTAQWRWEEPPIMPGSGRKPSNEPLIRVHVPENPILKEEERRKAAATAKAGES